MSFSYKLRSNKLGIICNNTRLKKYSDLIAVGKVDKKKLRE